MGEPGTIRWCDAESSMMNADESKVASVALRRIMQKYGSEFHRRGRGNIIG